MAMEQASARYFPPSASRWATAQGRAPTFRLWASEACARCGPHPRHEKDPRLHHAEGSVAFKIDEMAARLDGRTLRFGRRSHPPRDRAPNHARRKSLRPWSDKLRSASDWDVD